jgi:hypothetical protein
MIAYHRYQMVRFDKAFWDGAGEPAGPKWLTKMFTPETGQEVFEAFDNHRAWLVYLGDLTAIDYTFNHIELATPEWNHLWRQRFFPKKCPPFDQTAGMTGNDSNQQEPAHLQIWCNPCHRDEWVSFLKSVDVADYRKRFMTEQNQSATTK